jgi:UDP-N-acetyl-2-amino-2-deoxyglucuronate dehydrogenase
MNFAVIGVSGYIAPRHLKAIRDTGNRLVAATDPHDSAGILDQYSFDVRYFPEIERFDRHLDKLRRGSDQEKIHYVSICSPNYLHDAHMRLALRAGADVICEKPLVINPWNLDALHLLENETGKRINTVLQLRVHPALVELKAKFDHEGSPRSTHDVVITYVTGRGSWYLMSWKGSEERSGGLATNIGIHFFDLLIWLFGGVQRSELHLRQPKRLAGFIELKHANVRWFLSVHSEDLPFPAEAGKKATFRSITVDGQELEFTEGFTDLHTRIYEKTIKGDGFGIEDSRASIELVHTIRTSPLVHGNGTAHPFLLENKAFLDGMRHE